MRNRIFLWLTVLTLLMAQGCGLKGDLYLDNPEDTSAETTETLPPMPELETSVDDTGAGVAEDMETVEGLASPEDTNDSEGTDVLSDAPIAP